MYDERSRECLQQKMLSPYFATKPVAHEPDHNEVDARDELLVGMATNADLVESHRLSLGQLKLKTRDQEHELDGGEEMGSVPHGQALPGNRTEVESAPNRRVSRPGDGKDGDYPLDDVVDWLLEDFARIKTQPLEEGKYHLGGCTTMEGDTGGAKEMEEEGFASFLTSEQSVDQGSSESDSPSPGRPATDTTVMHLFKPRVNPLEIPGDEVGRVAPLKVVVRACSPDVVHWRSPGGLLSPRKERGRSPINEAAPSRFGGNAWSEISFSTNENAPAVTITVGPKRRLVMHLDTAGEAALDALICLSVSSFLPLHGNAPGGAPPTNPWLQFLPASSQTDMGDALDTTSSTHALSTQHRAGPAPPLSSSLAGAQPPSEPLSFIATIPPSPPHTYALSPRSPSPIPLDAPGPPLAFQASSPPLEQQAGAEEGWRGRALSPKGGLSFMQRVFGVPRSPGASPTSSPTPSPRPPGLGFGRKASEIGEFEMWSEVRLEECSGLPGGCPLTTGSSVVSVADAAGEGGVLPATSSRGERRSPSASGVRNRTGAGTDRVVGGGVMEPTPPPGRLGGDGLTAADSGPHDALARDISAALAEVALGGGKEQAEAVEVGCEGRGGRMKRPKLLVVVGAEEVAASLEEEVNNFPKASERQLPMWQREVVTRAMDRALQAEGREGEGEREEAPGISPGPLDLCGASEAEEGKGEQATFSPLDSVSALSATPSGDVGMEGGDARMLARDVEVAGTGRTEEEEVVKEEVVEVRGRGGEEGMKGVDPGSEGQVADREERKEMVVPGRHDASEGQRVAEAPTTQEPTCADARTTGHADVAVSYVHVSADSDSEKKAAPASDEPLLEEQGSADVAHAPDSANVAADISKGNFADASDEFGSPELKSPTTPPGVVVPGTQIPPLLSAAEAPSRQVASAETPVDSPGKRDQVASPAPFPTPICPPHTPSGAVDTPPFSSPPTTPLPSNSVKKSRARLVILPLFRSSRDSLTQAASAPASMEVSALSGKEAQAAAKALASSSTQDVAQFMARKNNFPRCLRPQVLDD